MYTNTTSFFRLLSVPKKKYVYLYIASFSGKTNYLLRGILKCWPLIGSAPFSVAPFNVYKYDNHLP